jgi:hypothetical protein
MKHFNNLILVSLLLISQNNGFCQTNQVEKRKTTKVDHLEELINVSNALNGIGVIQQSLSFDDEEFNIDYIVEIYENDILIEEKTIFSGRTYHQLDSLKRKFINNLVLAIKREKPNSSEFSFVFGSDINKVQNQVTIHQDYIRSFGLKEFEISNYLELNRSIPFALYGAFWEFDFNGITAMRFCSTNEKLKSRSDDQINGKSPFYYIFSFRLTL